MVTEQDVYCWTGTFLHISKAFAKSSYEIDDQATKQEILEWDAPSSIEAMLSYKFLRICGFVQDDNPVSRQGQADERTCIPQSLRNISLAWCSISSLPY